MAAAPPPLKEIHEEAEEGVGGSGSGASSPVTAARASGQQSEPDPVDAFPSSRAGAVVIRRLEHRRFVYNRLGQNFESLNCQTPLWSFGQKVSENQFLAPSEHLLPRLKSSEVDHFKAI